MLSWSGISTIIAVVLDHPPDVAFSPAHLLLFVWWVTKMFQPPVDVGARAKCMGMLLVDHFVHELRLSLDDLFNLLESCTKLYELMLSALPTFFSSLCCASRARFFLPLLLSCRGKEALRSLLPFPSVHPILLQRVAISLVGTIRSQGDTDGK